MSHRRSCHVESLKHEFHFTWKTCSITAATAPRLCLAVTASP